MRPLRFIHAADTHLDAAFTGLSLVNHDMRALLHSATFTALERLFALCLAEQVDFLILAGDITNAEDRSLKAQWALHDGCVRLAEAGISVFIVHGNHDPLSSRLSSLQWPDSVTFFGTEVESVPFYVGGELRAVVHGISYATAVEKRNLSKFFKRGAEICPHIGVLHTSIGEADGQKRYAPCTIKDLQAAGMDYWALGHIHKRQVLSENPPIVYPGCTQGLHVQEEGEKGCLAVTLSPETTSGTALYACERHFHVLGSVVWRILELPVLLEDTLDALEIRLQKKLAEELESLTPPCEILIIRLRLTGRTNLDGELRQQATLEGLAERCNALPNTIERATQKLWVKDIQSHTRPPVDKDSLHARTDLQGEISRLAEEWQNDPASLHACNKALDEIFSHKVLGKMLEPLNNEDIARLLSDAEALCIDTMEKS